MPTYAASVVAPKGELGGATAPLSGSVSPPSGKFFHLSGKFFHLSGKTDDDNNLKEFKFRKARFCRVFHSFVLQKSIRREKFHPQNVGNGICETLHFKIFPTTPLAKLLVGQTNIPSLKTFLARTPMFD